MEPKIGGRSSFEFLFLSHFLSLCSQNEETTRKRNIYISPPANACPQVYDWAVCDGARGRDIAREHQRGSRGGRRGVPVHSGEPDGEGTPFGSSQHLRPAPRTPDGELRRCGRRDHRHQMSGRWFPNSEHHLGERSVSSFPRVTVNVLTGSSMVKRCVTLIFKLVRLFDSDARPFFFF